MDKEKVFEILKKKRLLPLVTITDKEDVIPLANAFIQGDLPIVEIAYRSNLASYAITEMSKIPGMIVGAGTITNLEQLKEALACGAKFIVTPGFNEEVTRYAVEHDVLIFPGVVTPSEIVKARSMGVNQMKFFPAENYGGVSTLKALHAPFADCVFLPTGGVGVKNYKEYLELDYVIAVGGSFITPSSYMKEKNWEGLSEFIASL